MGNHRRDATTTPVYANVRRKSPETDIGARKFALQRRV
jgi:hypothetical protein